MYLYTCKFLQGYWEKRWVGGMPVTMATNLAARGVNRVIIISTILFGDVES